MSQQSAVEFVTRTSADAQVFMDVIEATGGLDPTHVDDAQFVAATAVGRRAGYAFSPAELRQAFDAFAAAHPAQVYDRELSLAELDLVAGGGNPECQKVKPGTGRSPQSFAVLGKLV